MLNSITWYYSTDFNSCIFSLGWDQAGLGKVQVRANIENTIWFESYSNSNISHSEWMGCGTASVQHERGRLRELE